MGTLRSVCHMLLILCAISLTTSYRLNVPRVLLPYHPKIPVHFMLEVKGGCFTWRSTRPDIVSVEPIQPDPTGCSDRAIITSKSKYEEEQNSVIFAENFAAGVSLSCGVTVDVVERISITTTTKILFVDAAPAQMIVEGYNKEGDKFSTLGGIPFDWNFISSDNPRAIRIIPFAQSKYDAPKEIMKLEKEKQKGYVVLVEGALTGSATLSAKFSEPLFSKVETNSIDLMVVANVLLVPSHDLYLPVHSIVHYRAQVIKQKAIEDIPLPSSQYSLALSDSSVCDLDVYTSKVTAKSLGRTEVTLVDSHMKGKLGVKPQSSHIYVVDPDVITFSIDRGNNWYLQKGVDYKIHVRLSDAFGNAMHIPDNALFHTTLSEQHFDVIERSKNGTYFYVIAKKSGTTSIQSSLVSIQDEYGVEHPFAATIAADQELQITDKLEAHPYIVVFPYHPNKPYTYQLRATGGTGSYSWQSSNPRVGAIDENRGKLTTGEIGESIIRVEDVYNPQHFALVHVYVLEPAELHFGESHVEAELEKELTLNVLMHGLDPKSQKLMPFTDCRHIPFKISVDDATIFKYLRDVPSEIPSEGRGCATVSLKALSIGDTKAKVQFDRFIDTIDISAFPPLVLSTNYQLLLATGSEIHLDLQGGPRPWMHDSSKYFTSAVPDNKKYVKIFGDIMNYKLQCSKQVGDVDVIVSVGNYKSKTNPLPVVSKATITVCCAVPERIALNTRHPAAKPGLPPCPSFVHSVFYGYPSVLLLTAYGRCVGSFDAEERMFDSLTSAKAKYDVDNEKLLTVKSNDQFPSEANKLTATAHPTGKSGTAKISAVATIGDQKLHTSLTLNLVGIAVAKPPSIVLWNAPDVRGSVHIQGGSGHFWLETTEVSQYANAQLQHIQDNDSEVVLSPVSQGSTKLSVYDLCIEGARLDINIKVTDVNKVKIIGSDLVEMNAIAPLRIEVLDIDDQPFSSQDVKMMDLDVVSQQHDFIRLTPVNLLEHHARGISVGTSSIIATVKSSTGTVVRSTPHLLQVFSPLRIYPEVVTLIPESVFQFEIVGGPIPTPELYFNMSKSGIVDINSIGLIKSTKTLGETTVTAIVTNGKSKDIISQDTAVVKVVSLAGIRLVLSSSIVEEGDIISAHIEGLDQDETPFAFGGADYPLNIVWKISATEVLAFDSLLTDVVEQQNHNRFGARFVAHKNGKVNVEAIVTIHPQSTKHFSSRKKHFTDSAQIIVQEALRLSSPRKSSESILITPSTALDLTANRPNQQVTFKTHQSSLISVIGDNQNILLSGNNEGSAPLHLHHQTSAFNETTFITVDVMHVKSLHLSMEMPIVSSFASSTIPFLPQGIKIRLRVQFRDSRGRLFNAANNDLKYRPHRFDLTDIVALENNRTFDIVLKQAGETVFRVWDAVNPRLSAYIRLPVGDVITPSERSLFVGDLVCFGSPVKVGLAPTQLVGLTWGTSGHSDKFIKFIHQNAGEAVMVAPGDASVYVKLSPEGQNATTFSTLKIQQPSSLRFINSPSHVSNIKGRTFTFPVQFGANLNETSRNIYGCDGTDLTVFSKIRPPFDCISSITGGVAHVSAVNLFTTRAIFDPTTGSYACIITDQIFELKSHQINDFENSQLTVSAQWNDDSNVKSSISVPFYPRFVVHDDELLLNNLENEHALLKISAVKALQNSMRIETCHPNIINVEKVSAKGGKDKIGNLHYRASLNVHAAALWSDKADRCIITIKNLLTDQTESVPVRIRMFGDATKLAINAFKYQGLFGWVRHLVDTIWPYLTSALLLLISGLLLYLGYQRGIQKTAAENDPNTYQKGYSSNSSLNYSGLKPIYTSTPDEHKSPVTGVAAKFRSNASSMQQHRNISGKLFDDDSFNTSRYSAGSGNESYLNGSNRSTLYNRYYNQ